MPDRRRPTSTKARAILISGASGSGKTHLLESLAVRADMADCEILEMDDLKYWTRPWWSRAPEKSAFQAWYRRNVAESGKLARELEHNVLDHDGQTLLIKWRFLKAALGSPRLVVVKPKIMSGKEHATRFYQIVSLLLELDLLHVALLPSPLRYAMNLSSRRSMRSDVREWVRIRYRQSSFDLVIRYGVRGLGATEGDAVARLMTADDGGRVVPRRGLR